MIIQRKIQTTVFASATFAATFGGLTYLFAFAAPPPNKVSADIAKYKEEVRKAIAKLDKLEPNWQLKDLLASRKKIPDEQNGALIVQKAFEKLPKDWDRWTWDGYIDFPPPPVLMLQDKHYLETKKHLQRLRSAVIRARRLTDYPTGQFRFKFAEKYYVTKSSSSANARVIARLLELDSLVLLQEKRNEGAAKSCLGIFHVARAVGDEPHVMSQLARIGISAIGTGQLERLLAQSGLDTKFLMRFQKLLRSECDHSFVLHSLRSEFSGAHDLLTKLTAGKLKWQELRKKKISKSPFMENYGGDFYSGGKVYESQAFLLGIFAEILQICKDQPKTQLDALAHFYKPIATTIEKKSPKTYLDSIVQVLPALIHLERRADAKSECAHGAIAAERFRMMKKRWPNSFSELVRNGFLTEIPIDLFSRKPLKFRKTADGLVIYSIMREFPYYDSNSGHYKGDALDNPYKPRQISRIEFRLWNSDKRRQPAPPEKKQEPGIFNLPPEVIQPGEPPPEFGGIEQDCVGFGDAIRTSGLMSVKGRGASPVASGISLCRTSSAAATQPTIA